MIAFEAVLLDLFGTVVFFEADRIPIVDIGGRARRLSIGGFDRILAEVYPPIEPSRFLDALDNVSRALEHERARDHREVLSQERFRRALLACGARGDIDEAAEALCRLHMNGLAQAVVCPPDRRDLLRRLHAGRALGLVSNFDHAPTAHALLEQFELREIFDCLVISAEVGLRKPHPEIFLRACDLLGVGPNGALHVGDSYDADIRGAHAAGIASLWVDAGTGAPAPALGRIADLAELPDWLSRTSVPV